jgi:NAD(P)-dependent dehydrogenase (short-subunit alcohol dehydrogenase family)
LIYYSLDIDIIQAIREVTIDIDLPTARLQAMAGTILITGANSSLAIPAVKHLLTKHPTYSCILTVRNTSDSDANTKRLRETIAQHQGAGADASSRISIRQLDLSNLSAVHEIAQTIASEVANGKLPPLASIVCNAYYWNLVGEAELTVDGYDKTFQVAHLAHAVLVLRLLGSFGTQGGRIVLFSSVAHWPGKIKGAKYPPVIPDDLELLVTPAADSPPDNTGRGFQRYAVAKLAVTMWMYALNRYLQKVKTFIIPPKTTQGGFP